MTLANYTKIAQSENAEELIKQLGLADTFESVWETTIDDQPESVSENVLIEETLKEADTEYLFVESIISNGINRIVYTVLTPEPEEDVVDNTNYGGTTTLSLPEIVKGTKAENLLNENLELTKFEPTAKNELELGWEFND